jgi:hypothetical protein
VHNPSALMENIYLLSFARKQTSFYDDKKRIENKSAHQTMNN